MIARYLFIAALACMFIVLACETPENPVYGPDNPDPNPPGTPAAVLTAINPPSELPGKTVTITGTGFNTEPSGNLVSFGANSAEVTAASATELSVILPPSSGEVNVKVAVGGSVEWSNELTFEFLSFIPEIPNPQHTLINNDITWPMGIDVDDAGNVYVGGAEDGEIYKIDPAGVKTVFATVQIYGSLHFGPDDYLYVANSDEGKVVRISPDGSTVEDYASHGGVRDFDWDENGNMYLIGSGDISVMPPGGSATIIYDEAGSNRNCRIFDGYLYMNEVWGGVITRYDISGTEIGEKEVVLEGNNPLALDFDVEGVLYWTEAWQTVIYVFAPGGAEEAVIYEDEIVASERLRYMTYYGQDIYVVWPGNNGIGTVEKVLIGRDQAPRYGRQ